MRSIVHTDNSIVAGRKQKTVRFLVGSCCSVQGKVEYRLDHNTGGGLTLRITLCLQTSQHQHHHRLSWSLFTTTSTKFIIITIYIYIFLLQGAASRALARSRWPACRRLDDIDESAKEAVNNACKQWRR